METLPSSPTANQASRTFRQLHDLFNHEPTDGRVDELAAELAVQVAAFRHPVCLGLFEHKKLRKIYGLTYLLLAHRVTLCSKRREIDGMVFIYASIELPSDGEFVGMLTREVPQRLAA